MKMRTLLRGVLSTVVMIAVGGGAIAGSEPPHAAYRSSEGCPQIPAEPVEEGEGQFSDYGVGLVFREYDLDGDGRPDFMTGRQIDALSQSLPDAQMSGSEVRPLFYWIDLNSDSTYDQVWIDRGGAGRCDDMALYEGPAQGRALLPIYAEHVLH